MIFAHAMASTSSTDGEDFDSSILVNSDSHFETNFEMYVVVASASSYSAVW